MLIVSMKTVDKKSHHAHAHSLLRVCLLRRGIEYSENTPIIKNRYGKPQLAEHPEIHYNLSHCEGGAACLISEHECGVDCERIRGYRPHVLRRAFSETERAALEAAPEEERNRLFFQLWTLKEAYIKAIGMGLSYPLNEAEFAFAGGNIVTNIEGYDFRQYIKDDLVISVCEKMGDC